MAGAKMKTAMRVVALLPVVLLLGIVGIKMTAGDPSSPLNNVPGVQTIYELGNEAPSADVTLPPSETPSPTTAITALPTDLTDALAAGATMPVSSITTKAPAPDKTTTAPAPEPTVGSGGGTGGGTGGGGDDSPSPTSKPTTNPTTNPTTSSPAPSPTCYFVVVPVPCG